MRILDIIKKGWNRLGQIDEENSNENDNIRILEKNGNPYLLQKPNIEKTVARDLRESIQAKIDTSIANQAARKKTDEKQKGSNSITK